jgi:hypothetical protein
MEKLMFESIIQLTALILTLESAIFLAKGNLGLSAESIAELASTKYGANLKVIENLAHQNAYSRIGIILLCISVFIQMITILLISGAKFLAISTSNLIISFVVSGFVFLVCWKLAAYKANNLYQQSKKIIDNRRRAN